MNTYAYAGANPVNLIDPLGLSLTQDFSNALSDLATSASNAFNAAQQDLAAVGQSLQQYPCVVAAENKWNEAVKVYQQEVFPIYAAYDFLKAIATLGEDYVGGILTIAPVILPPAPGASWGIHCNPTDCPPFGNNWPPPPVNK